MGITISRGGKRDDVVAHVHDQAASLKLVHTSERFAMAIGVIEHGVDEAAKLTGDTDQLSVSASVDDEKTHVNFYLSCSVSFDQTPKVAERDTSGDPVNSASPPTTHDEHDKGAGPVGTGG